MRNKRTIKTRKTIKTSNRKYTKKNQKGGYNCKTVDEDLSQSKKIKIVLSHGVLACAKGHETIPLPEGYNVIYMVELTKTHK